MKNCPKCNTLYPRKLLGLLVDKHCQNISCSDYYANNMGMDGVENFSRLKGNKKKPKNYDWVTSPPKIHQLKHYPDSLTVPLANKGWFATEAALNSAYPLGSPGDYASVGATDSVWVWNMSILAWINSIVTGDGKIGSRVSIDPTMPAKDQFKKAFEYFFGDKFENFEVGRMHVDVNGYAEAHATYTYFDRKMLFATFKIKSSIWELTYWREET